MAGIVTLVSESQQPIVPALTLCYILPALHDALRGGCDDIVSAQRARGAVSILPDACPF